MYPSQDRLTLDALLSDPLTRLVMRSDNITPEDVAQAFDEAKTGLARPRMLRYGRGRAFAACAAEPNMQWGHY